jgi:hypothetical protein
VSANRITVAEWRRMASRGKAKPVAAAKQKMPRVKKPPPVISWRVSTSPGRVSVRIDGLRLVSEGNRRGHWRIAHNRKCAQQEIVKNALLGVNLWHWVELPLRVTTVRVAPRRFDTDNAVSSSKNTRDQIAKELSIDDRDERIDWQVAQKRGEPNQYGVEIVIESATDRKST